MSKNETQAAETATQAAEADAPEANESKADAFRRIATRRVSNVLNAVRLLEGLTNKANYEYTDEQWEKMFAAVEGQLAKVKKLHAAGGVKAAVESGFEL